MINPTRETQLVEAFTKLSDTLIVGYDVVDLLQTLVETCQEILDISAAGILLADDDGQFDVVASTSEESNLVEIMQVDAEQGPCFECFTTGNAVLVPDIEVDSGRWPEFAAEAIDQHFRGCFALPLRLRDDVIGTLNLLRHESGPLDEGDIRAAQALANVATIGILHARSLSDSEAVRAQLQHALDSRVVIEQAKGFVAHEHGVSTEEAFQLVRAYARHEGLRLSDVARGIVDQTLTI